LRLERVYYMCSKR